VQGTSPTFLAKAAGLPGEGAGRPSRSAWRRESMTPAIAGGGQIGDERLDRGDKPLLEGHPIMRSASVALAFRLSS
jgi:hypothetical protein